MKKILALLLATALLAGALSGCNRTAAERLPVNTQTTPTEPELYLAPDFTVYDKDNNPVKLSDFKGKPVVLNFWATWCGPCIQEMPHFQAKYQSGDAGVEFVMVNLTDGVRETVSGVVTFLSDQGYTLPVYYDTQAEAATIYRVSSIPSTYFIDEEGYLIAGATGSLSEEMLQQGIDLLKK